MFFAELLEVFDLFVDQFKLLLHLLARQEHQFAAAAGSAAEAATTAETSATWAAWTLALSGRVLARRILLLGRSIPDRARDEGRHHGARQAFAADGGNGTPRGKHRRKAGLHNCIPSKVTWRARLLPV
ncbi:MAG: hypothetical protein C0483_19445 [Pirellula sp.]|nr:hypothetical protein [Pirellula sp.]